MSLWGTPNLRKHQRFFHHEHIRWTVWGCPFILSDTMPQRDAIPSPFTFEAAGEWMWDFFGDLQSIWDGCKMLENSGKCWEVRILNGQIMDDSCKWRFFQCFDFQDDLEGLSQSQPLNFLGGAVCQDALSWRGDRPVTLGSGQTDAPKVWRPTVPRGIWGT